MDDKKLTIGFIEQEHLGKKYADDFEHRGFVVIRHSLDEMHLENKAKIKDCDIVFIVVPTPTTPRGFNVEIVDGALSLVGEKKVAVIKSTLLPGTTKNLQEKYPYSTVLYSPEFLSETSAEYDITNPFSNIIGIPYETPENRAIAKEILSILLPAPFSLVCSSTEAEVIKYTHNLNGYVQVVLFNMIFDLASTLGCEWQIILDAIQADPAITSHYAQPMHKNGRGAGGEGFIKDIVAFRRLYQKVLPEDDLGLQVFRSLEHKNIDLLLTSGKDMELLREVYGDDPRHA